MSDTVFLTVLIPAFNEENAIKGTLKEISEYLKKRAVSAEVIVVDDGSRDNTFNNAQACSTFFRDFRVLKNDSNKGKGYSIKRGMFCAKGEYALFMDADNSTSIYEFDKILPFLKEGYDAVIASRRLKNSNVEEAQPLLRAKMGQFYIFLSRIILGLDFSDFNCGFKAYNMKSSRFIFDLQTMNDWSFDSELLFLIKKYNLKVKEVPVRWVHKSGSKVRPFRDAIRSFISIVRIKISDIKNVYKKGEK